MRLVGGCMGWYESACMGKGRSIKLQICFTTGTTCDVVHSF